MKKKLRLKASVKEIIIVVITALIVNIIGTLIANRFNQISNDSRFQVENYYEISQKKTEMLRTNQSK